MYSLASSTASTKDEYKRTHTADGTLRRYTSDMDTVDEATHKLGPINLLGDNKGVTFTAKNPVTSARSRHLDVRWFRIREFVKQDYVRVSHIYTHQNIADFFTKPLPSTTFQAFRQYLMNY